MLRERVILRPVDPSSISPGRMSRPKSEPRNLHRPAGTGAIRPPHRGNRQRAARLTLGLCCESYRLVRPLRPYS